MVRRFIGTTLFGAALLSMFACRDLSDVAGSAGAIVPTEESNKEIGSLLYATAPVTASSPRTQPERVETADPIVIDDCRVIAEEKQEVPAQKDGVIEVIGTLIDEKDVGNVPKDRLRQIEEVEIDESNPHNLRSVEMENGTAVKSNAEPEAAQYKRKRIRHYQELREGDIVDEGQVLARLDDRLARDELAIKQAKVNVAWYEMEAARKTKDEAYQRFLTQQRLVGIAAREDYRGARLVHETKVAEWHSKIEAFRQAELERDQARTNLELHEMRAKTPGMIKMTYKRKGESVRSLEPVFQILNLKAVRVEGLVGRQYLSRLMGATKGGKPMRVAVESSLAQPPIRILKGHTQDITGVAVGTRPDGKCFVVSTGEDRYLRGWMPDAANEQTIVKLPGTGIPTSVACAAQGSPTCWTVVGDSNGDVWRRSWSGPTDDPRVLENHHHGPVTCVAISPDGKYAASGGEDRRINIWNLTDGEHLYTIGDAHTGIITTLQFTPQSQLLSAARDNTLCVWTLGASGARREMVQTNRSGDVPHTSASPDGSRVLFDYAKELQVLSSPQGLNEGYLHRPAKAASFSGFALFSPDGNLILTSDGSENQVQLWRSPTAGNRRGYEIRKLISEPASLATCAAFAPDGSFIVTGHKSKDLCVWRSPNSQERGREFLAQLDMIDPTAESSSGQVRIRARVLKPGLMHNTTVTMVIDHAE